MTLFVSYSHESGSLEPPHPVWPSAKPPLSHQGRGEAFGGKVASILTSPHRKPDEDPFFGIVYIISLKNFLFPEGVVVWRM
jgi:hypothetical protein